MAVLVDDEILVIFAAVAPRKTSFGMRPDRQATTLSTAGAKFSNSDFPVAA
jgi:hypothetical protein